MDSAAYVRGAAAKVDADTRMIAGDKARLASLELVVTGLSKAERAAGSYHQQVEAYNRSQAGIIQGQMQMAAANDNVASSFHITGAQALSVAGHLKTAAAAAYVLSPAFRALVNPAIATGLQVTGGAIAAMSPAAGAVAATILARVVPALSFVSRIALPIMLAVEAWKLLNHTIQLGAGLVEKYTPKRDPGVVENLNKLTRLQDRDVSAGQVQYATDWEAA
jgi:hypothetical protein